MRKWEYKFLTQNIQDKGLSAASDAANLWNERFKDGNNKTALDTLNELGQKGWELFAVTPVATDFGASSGGETSQILFSLRRRLE